MNRRDVLKALPALAVLPLATPVVARDATPVRDHGFRPFPISVMTSRLRLPGSTVTAIARGWAPGQAKHCRLCERCSAHDDHCLVMTDVIVPNETVALHSTVGTELQVDPD
jgi:hypothetical protein